jgi:glutaredoxin
VEYIDVLAASRNLKQMLEHSKGDRRVPVIVEDGGRAKIGYGGS